MSIYRSFAEQALHYFLRPHESVPDAALEHAAAWRGPEMAAHPERWRVELCGHDIDELARAADSARRAGRSMQELDAAAFPLPGLAESFRDWRTRLRDGCGFVCVRGLPVRDWGEELSSLVYWGIGHHLGVPGAQNPQGELLGHVTDYGEEADDPMVRRYRTTGNIDFHCDAADVVGLLCLQKAREGGQSRIASSVTVFNEILRRRPELVPRLFRPFQLDRRGEERPGEAPAIEIAPCAYAGGTLRTFWHSDYFRSAPRHASVAPLTTDELALLDLYDELAASPEIHLDMWLEPGDMQFISNHTIVHARTAYTDEPQARRHLLRLWLSLD